MSDETRDLVWKHIKSIATCMMVTHDGERVVARPMRGIIRPEENAIWFFTDASTDKDSEISHDPRGCLTFADVHDQTYVCVSGHLHHMNDPARIRELWNEGADVYFPEGPDDPNVRLLRFTPEHGEYWDSPSSPIVLAIKFLQAKLSKEKPEMGENASTTLS